MLTSATMPARAVHLTEKTLCNLADTADFGRGLRGLERFANDTLGLPLDLCRFESVVNNWDAMLFGLRRMKLKDGNWSADWA